MSIVIPDIRHWYNIDARPRYAEPHPELYRVLNEGTPRYREHLVDFAGCTDALAEIPLETDSPTGPCWDNPFFTGLDAIALHGFLAKLKPKTYFEIGSGNSTKFARHAITSHKLDTAIVSLDPEPRAEIDSLCDEVIRTRLERADLQAFERLNAGDILFYDGSHVTCMNSDVVVFFLEVLPRLRPGVWVHVHDVFLPWDYPQEWAERYYSEAYMLACWLLAGHRLRVEFPVYFVSRQPYAREIMGSPSVAPLQGGSFWFQM